MQDRIFFISLLFAALGLTAGQAAHAKKMYRWVDENGKTFLSDQVPPEYVQHRHEELSEKGRVVQITEKAKTKEQLELDRRLESLRKAQEAIIAKQKVNDKVLLSAFRSLNDMQEALKKKMHAMDSQIMLLQSNKNRAETELENHLKRAATHERSGEKIPEALARDIDKAKAQIKTVADEIAKQEDKKRHVKAAFEADIQRYKFLTHSDTEAPQALSDKTAEMKAAVELGLYLCDNPSQCAKAWESAHQFVRRFSTMPTDIDNDKLLMTAEPAADSDLSLSVSKIDMGNNQQQLFLDIRCRQSSLGMELCASDKVRDIRTSFRSYIENAVTAAKAD
jgi:outer membrane murein-binding lipoprotein Lpp